MKIETNKFTSRYKSKIQHDINITPFVDIMLVLLVMFMLASNMLNSGIDMNLPKSNQYFSEKDQYVNISIDKFSRIYLEDKLINKNDLVKKIQALIKENSKIKILIYGDKETNYGSIIEIFNFLKKADIDDVVLITEE